MNLYNDPNKDNEQLWYYISQLPTSLLGTWNEKNVYYMNTKDVVLDEKNIWFLKYKGLNDFFLMWIVYFHNGSYTKKMWSSILIYVREHAPSEIYSF